MNNKLKVGQLQVLDIVLKNLSSVANAPKMQFVIKCNENLFAGDFLTFNNCNEPLVKSNNRTNVLNFNFGDILNPFIDNFSEGVSQRKLNNLDLLLKTMLDSQYLKTLPTLNPDMGLIPCLYSVIDLAHPNEQSLLEFYMLSENEEYEVISLIALK